MSSLSLRWEYWYIFIHQLAPLFVVVFLLLQYANAIMPWQQLYSLFQQWFVLSEGWVESQRDHSQLWWVRGYPEFFIVTIHHRNHLLCGQSKLVYILLNQWSHQQSSSKKSGAILSSQMSSLSLRLGNGYTFIHQLAPLFVVVLLLLQ